VQPVDESIDNSLRHKIQTGNSGEDRGIKEALQHVGDVSARTGTLACAG
jgi:hypothetical protein